MSDKIENPPAFPFVLPVLDGKSTYHDGMSLRDYFAGQALAGTLANRNFEGGRFDEISRAAFLIADAMLAERAKSEGK
jgi:hydroxylamine reductase (hybrid-cluster protein)